MPEQHNGPQQEWFLVKQFDDATANLTVRIHKKAGYRPFFSYEIGRLTQDKKFNRFLQGRMISNQGRVHFDRLNITALTQLIELAENWMQEEGQKNEDSIIEKKIEREKKGEVKGPPQRPGLKALSKQDKARRTSQAKTFEELQKRDS